MLRSVSIHNRVRLKSDAGQSQAHWLAEVAAPDTSDKLGIYVTRKRLIIINYHDRFSRAVCTVLATGEIRSGRVIYVRMC